MDRTAKHRSVRRRVMRPIGAAVLLSAAWCLLGTGTAVAQSDPVQVQKQQLADLNRGNVTAVMALFTPDASYEAGSCIPKACVGTAAIQAEITKEVADHLQVTESSAAASGTTVTGSVSITSNGIRAVSGVQRILATFVVTTRNGLVSSVVTKPDLTDPQTVTFIKAEAAAQRPAALAFTGVNAGPMAVTGLVLLVAGAALAAGTRRRASA